MWIVIEFELSLRAHTSNIRSTPIFKARLHDEKGNFVGWRRLILNGSRAIGSGMLRIVFGVRSEKPWISYSAIKELDQFLDADSRTAGLSTSHNDNAICMTQ